jgi:hypothetical protein
VLKYESVILLGGNDEFLNYGNIKRSRHEINISSPSSAEVKKAWSYISTPPIRFHGMLLN